MHTKRIDVTLLIYGMLLSGSSFSKKTLSRKIHGVDAVKKTPTIPDFAASVNVSAMHAIAASLGSAAVADFWSAMKQENLRYRDTKVEGLRRALGNYQTYSGNPLIDVPVELFEHINLPAVAALRQLFFSRMRDDLFRRFY